MTDKVEKDQTRCTIDEPTTGTTRRSVLTGMTVAGLSGTFVGFAGRASAESTAERFQKYFDQFETVVDVTEAGADNTGEQSITPVLEELRDDDTLLMFPPGEYYIDEQFRFTGFENFGLVGNDATLVPANYNDFDGPQYRLFRLGVAYNPGKKLLFEGFRVDQTGTDTGIRTIDAVVDHDLLVRDVTVEGKHDSGTKGPARFAISDPDGSGVVERFRAPDGAAFTKYTPNEGNLWRGPTGILANYPHVGTLLFADCELGAFPDNGLYASKGGGEIRVEGGTYANSDTAQIRIGGPGSYVKDARVVVDQNRRDDRGQRGVRVEHGTDVLIENVTVKNTAPMANAHAICLLDDADDVRIEDVDITIRGDGVPTGIYVSGSAKAADVVDTTITQDTPGGFGVFVGDGTSGKVKLIRVSIDGDAGDDSEKAAIRNERDDVRFAKLDIDQTGHHDRRAVVNWGDDCKFYRGSYRAGGVPIVDGAHSSWIEDIYAESSNDEAAIDLYDSSSDTYIKENTIINGVRDRGCDGLTMWGNTYE